MNSAPARAKKLGMDVIQASETLIALCEAGWICFNGTRDYIDYWMVSELGHRLLATPLVPRFPREEGHRIVAEVIEMARAINSEPERSRRIKEIRLFGSVLTGSHDETVGDVDMVVLVERRALPRSFWGIGTSRMQGALGLGPCRPALLAASRSSDV
jgi:hypothetical protein